MPKVMKKNRLKLFEGTLTDCENFLKIYGYDKDTKKYTIVVDAIQEFVAVENITEFLVEHVELTDFQDDAVKIVEQDNTVQEVKKTFMQKLRDGVNG